ncbi:hypothetical protein PPL_09509 [Heterostelium album PN500]|uniref:Uncharacterized protein n=1 Tax=Heterostelium pallidum (strain ATCC 26659 / Pp 5 / PN500) TaxID=670386 RepID=D3BN98_HETP5|nr:hypothetical protein PPL_09509 [Heterostelium album PN500]EFA76758.1 hypothetical protein PPL_09509 [Heterostelium album PN500]|eukprot:XP_020428890.1 hypothetical protein PPL_09509 [Heterostelium album PN500]
MINVIFKNSCLSLNNYLCLNRSSTNALLSLASYRQYNQISSSSSNLHYRYNCTLSSPTIQPTSTTTLINNNNSSSNNNNNSSDNNNSQVLNLKNKNGKSSSTTTSTVTSSSSSSPQQKPKKYNNNNNSNASHQNEKKERKQFVKLPGSSSTNVWDKKESNPFVRETEIPKVPFDQSIFDLYSNLYKSESLPKYFKDNINNKNIDKLVSEIQSLSNQPKYWLAVSIISTLVDLRPKLSQPLPPKNSDVKNRGSVEEREKTLGEDVLQFRKLVLAATRYTLAIDDSAPIKHDQLVKLYFNFNHIAYLQSQHEILMEQVRLKSNQPTSGDEHLQSMMNSIKMLSMDTSFLYDYLSCNESSNFIRPFFDNAHLQWTSSVIQVGLKNRSERIQKRIQSNNSNSNSNNNNSQETTSTVSFDELEKIINNPLDKDHLELPSFVVNSELNGQYDIVDFIEGQLPGQLEIASKLINSVIMFYLLVDRYEMALHWYSRRLKIGLSPNHFTIFPFIVYHEFRGDNLLEHWESVLDQYPVDKRRRSNFRREFKFNFIMTARRVLVNPGVRAEAKDTEREALEKIIKLGHTGKMIYLLNQYFERGLLPSGTTLIRAAQNSAGLPTWQQYVPTTPDFVRCLLFSPRAYEADLREKNMLGGWNRLKSERPIMVYTNIMILNSILCGLLNHNEIEAAVRITIEMTKRKMKVFEWIHRKFSEKFIEIGYFDEDYYKYMPSILQEYGALFRFNQMASCDVKVAYSYLCAVNMQTKTKPFLTIAVNLYDRIYTMNDDINFAHLMKFFGEVNLFYLYSVLFELFAQRGYAKLGLQLLNSNLAFFLNQKHLLNHQMVSDILRTLCYTASSEARELQVKIFKAFMSANPPAANKHLSEIHNIMSHVNKELNDPQITELLNSIDLNYTVAPKLPKALVDDIQQSLLAAFSRL